MSKCPDCNGTGEYVGFNSREECASCRGTGAKDGITDALQSVLDFNNDIGHDEIDLYDYVNSMNGSVNQATIPPGPQITIGTKIYVYDAGWYEVEVVDIKNKTIHATDPSNAFFIPANGPVWNATQARWEYIKSGTPIWH